MTEAAGWQFWIDRGGTFTDIVAVAPDGTLTTAKLLSENPSQYADAALAGIERLRSRHCAGSGPVDQGSIAYVKMGTTVGTNALLEHRGAPTVLVITEGFADLLRIGSQQRPDIFALDVRLPQMLYCDVVEARERVDADGRIRTPLDEERLAAHLAAARNEGAHSVAIALLNAYRCAANEEAAERIALQAGFGHVSISSRVSPLIKLVDRGDTTVVDAYLTPVLQSYVTKIRAGLDGQLDPDKLLFMQSHGGLVEADRFRGSDSVLSGPAAGVVGMATTAREAGFEHVIGFDMGGTSTDVSVYAGHYERMSAATIAGHRIALPMMRINTVAAGGGSILHYRLGRMQVGPDSAGADPGPACYRNDGPLTLTDANVLLGRIQADYFPRVFGPNADLGIDACVVEAGFERMATDVSAASTRRLTAASLADGFLKIAVQNMASAIEQISVQRGHDVTQFALSCFGGAGGQHACQVADALGVETILVDPLSGVLSAYGIGVAERRTILPASLNCKLDDRGLRRAVRSLAELSAEASRRTGNRARMESRIFVRVDGSDALIPVPFFEGMARDRLVAGFSESHADRFGFVQTGAALMLHSLEVEAIVRLDAPQRSKPTSNGETFEPDAHRRIWFDGAWRMTPVWRRSSIAPNALLRAPALIVEDNATIVLEHGWQAKCDDSGTLVLTRSAPRRQRDNVRTGVDPIMLEIFNNQFMNVAVQMGAVLEQTAHSVNIKERLDYSCAIFDRDGELIANAPHVPVHLGSMSDSVLAVIRCADELRPGDAYLLNAPYIGGTHLPDLTVVTPIFEPDLPDPSFFVASRAHHADVGGTTPGSMPALSRHIDDEGVVIEPTRILRNGGFLEHRIRRILAAGAHPARNIDQNVADLKAQLAANSRGRGQIDRLLERYGSDAVHAYMSHVRANAEECARAAIRRLSGGSFSTTLDSGDKIAVAVAIDGERGEARIDFSGTGGTSAANLNAPQSVVRAVVLYVLRALIAEGIPLNAGCLVPVEIVIPEACLLDPRYPAAVAGGNVETSQCIADALLAALGAQAASQGTMNNFTFGDDTHQYYETICGGCGAGPGFDGASAVHSHMTNSKLTDIEVLEQRFPVRVRRFEIRRGSGGDGAWRGGDGVVRELEFLSPMSGSLLTNRRKLAPFGLDGGLPGQCGKNTIVRHDGRREILPSAALTTFDRGDRIVIETPGGGGYGLPPKSAN